MALPDRECLLGLPVLFKASTIPNIPRGAWTQRVWQGTAHVQGKPRMVPMPHFESGLGVGVEITLF